jgi:hypothetical protein
MTEYFEGLTPKDDKADIKAKYRVLFGSEIGQEVLSDILINFCNFGCFLDSDKERIEYNVGINILSRMKVFTSQVNKKDIITALYNVKR